MRPMSDALFPDPTADDAREGSLMDCRRFRMHHLAYLDDTLSGDDTTAAQRHVLACDACAAHDTLVRRSLMIARSLPTIEPSSEFQARLRARLAACRDEPVPPVVTAAAHRRRAARTAAAVTVGALVATMGWRTVSAFEREAAVIAMQPVVASRPADPMPNPYITPALMQAMATGNPVWPAAVLIEDVPTHFVSADFNFVDDMK